MERITNGHLERAIARLNTLTGSPLKPYVQEDGKYKAQIGCYHLEGAYGKVGLARMSNETGGTSTVFHFSGKRELLNLINAMILGLEAR